MAGSPPYQARHSASLNTVTRAAPGPMSSGRKKRPSAGAICSVRNRPGVARPPSTPSDDAPRRAVNGQSRPRPTDDRVRLARAKSSTSGGDPMQNPSTEGCVSQIATRRRESANGSGLKSTPSTTEKIATLIPMPRARVSTARTEKPGLLRSARTA